MGAWLRAIGLERYEEGLVHNGWDDLEFLRWGRGRRWIGWVSGLRTGLWAFLDLLDLLVHLQASRSHSDITEEDLEEAGVQDPAHKRLLLDTLQLSK
jgi:phosphatidylinositol-3,4,5-trisphosphate 5-phosphatase 2